MKQALGIVEVQGLVYTIVCADAAVKAANVNLLGYEPAKGNACFVLKFAGNVGAVKAAVDAALALAKKGGRFAVGYAIPRPSDACWDLVNRENAADENSNIPEPETEPENAEAYTEVEETEAVKDIIEAETEVEDEKQATCNLCGDPECSRHKGESHELCIHHKK